jgi:putative flippase GtrA
MTIPAECEAPELDAMQPQTFCAEELQKQQSHSTLLRWCKFNAVGAMGIVTQFAVLFVLKGALHLNYLAATALAVEAAVLHNFVWHERFTWADRVSVERSGAKLIRASRSSVAQRLFRFHAANGAVSIFGDLALMKLMVDFGRMNYLAANGVAIALCSLANFIASEHWVFGEAKEG